jgi:hypothetical protein
MSNDWKIVRTGDGESDWKVEKVMSEVKWYNRGQTGEYLRDWADVLVHSGNPDWLGLAKKAKRAGLSDAEVNEFLKSEEE